MYNFKLTPGTLCLIEEYEDECTNVTTHEPGTLKGGTPVRVVAVEEIDCPARVNGECKAACKKLNDMYCGYNVTVEDCNGDRWMFRCVPEEDDDYFPLAILEDGDAEFLFSKTASRRYKLREFTDDGFSVKYHGPFKLLISALTCFPALKSPAGWSRWSVLAAIALVALWGLSEIIAGIIYNRHPLPLAAYRFYHNPEENKKALETLLKMPTSTPK